MVLLAAALGGCSGDPQPQGPTPEPSPAPPATSPVTPAEALSFDCDAVAAARQSLGDASTAELERLGIDRSAPEAFSVVLLTTSQGAAEYWAAIFAATEPVATDELRSDVQAVAGYWAGLDEQLDAIEVADSSPAAVQAAADELATISQSQPDEALTAAQQRVQDELAATCGTDPAASTPSP